MRKFISAVLAVAMVMSMGFSSIAAAPKAVNTKAPATVVAKDDAKTPAPKTWVTVKDNSIVLTIGGKTYPAYQTSKTKTGITLVNVNGVLCLRFTDTTDKTRWVSLGDQNKIVLNGKFPMFTVDASVKSGVITFAANVAIGKYVINGAVTTNIHDQMTIEELEANGPCFVNLAKDAKIKKATAKPAAKIAAPAGCKVKIALSVSAPITSSGLPSRGHGSGGTSSGGTNNGGSDPTTPVVPSLQNAITTVEQLKALMSTGGTFAGKDLTIASELLKGRHSFDFTKVSAKSVTIAPLKVIVTPPAKTPGKTAAPENLLVFSKKAGDIFILADNIKLDSIDGLNSVTVKGETSAAANATIYAEVARVIADGTCTIEGFVDVMDVNGVAVTIKRTVKTLKALTGTTIIGGNGRVLNVEAFRNVTASSAIIKSLVVKASGLTVSGANYIDVITAEKSCTLVGPAPKVIVNNADVMISATSGITLLETSKPVTVTGGTVATAVATANGVNITATVTTLLTTPNVTKAPTVNDGVFASKTKLATPKLTVPTTAANRAEISIDVPASPKDTTWNVVFTDTSNTATGVSNLGTARKLPIAKYDNNADRTVTVTVTAIPTGTLTTKFANSDPAVYTIEYAAKTPSADETSVNNAKFMFMQAYKLADVSENGQTLASLKAHFLEMAKKAVGTTSGVTYTYDGDPAYVVADRKFTFTMNFTKNGAIATTGELIFTTSTNPKPAISVALANTDNIDAATKVVSYTYNTGAKATVLTATAAGATDITYQWYSDDDMSDANAVAITGATSTSYTPLTTGSDVDGKTVYYYCVATIKGTQESATSNYAKVTVNKIVTLALDDKQVVMADKNLTIGTDNTFTVKLTNATFAPSAEFELVGLPTGLSATVTGAGTDTLTFKIEGTAKTAVTSNANITVYIKTTGVTADAGANKDVLKADASKTDYYKLAETVTLKKNTGKTIEITSIEKVDGTDDTATTTKIKITFTAPIDGLTTSSIKFADGTGSATMGKLTQNPNNKAEWFLEVTTTKQGNIDVTISDFAGVVVTGTAKKTVALSLNKVKDNVITVDFTVATDKISITGNTGEVYYYLVDSADAYKSLVVNTPVESFKAPTTWKNVRFDESVILPENVGKFVLAIEFKDAKLANYDVSPAIAATVDPIFAAASIQPTDGTTNVTDYDFTISGVTEAIGKVNYYAKQEDTTPIAITGDTAIKTGTTVSLSNAADALQVTAKAAVTADTTYFVSYKVGGKAESKRVPITLQAYKKAVGTPIAIESITSATVGGVTELTIKLSNIANFKKANITLEGATLGDAEVADSNTGVYTVKLNAELVDGAKVTITIADFGTFDFPAEAKEFVIVNDAKKLTITDPSAIEGLAEGNDNVKANAELLASITCTNNVGTVTYAFATGAGDTDNTKMVLTAAGKLSVGGTALTKGSYSVLVRATDPDTGKTAEKVIAFTVGEKVVETLTSITAPTFTTFTAAYTTKEEAITALQSAVPTVAIATNTSTTSTLPIVWTIESYTVTAGTTNTFTWTATLGEVVTNPNKVTLTGTVVVTNKAA